MTRMRKFYDRGQKIANCLSCNLCNQLLTDAMKIIECFHTFCKECIYNKMREEELDCCPVCDIYLGVNPLTKIRADFNLQDMRNQLFPAGKENEAREALPAVLMHASAKRELKKIKRHVAEVEDRKVPKEERIFGDASLLPQGFFYDHLPPYHGTWTFKLNASQTQKGSPPLPQITSCYAQMRDLSVPIAYIYKFLKKKLDLESEDEVEITCMGKTVTPTTTADKLVKFWLTKNKKNDGTKDGLKAHLYYGRKVPSPSS